MVVVAAAEGAAAAASSSLPSPPFSPSAALSGGAGLPNAAEPATSNELLSATSKAAIPVSFVGLCGCAAGATSLRVATRGGCCGAEEEEEEEQGGGGEQGPPFCCCSCCCCCC